MTQTNATDPPEKRLPRSARLTPGTPVHRTDDDTERGIVTSSDDWWDTFQLGGVPISGQVLVEWPRGGRTVRRWELISDLNVDTSKEASQ